MPYDTYLELTRRIPGAVPFSKVTRLKPNTEVTALVLHKDHNWHGRWNFLTESRCYTSRYSLLCSTVPKMNSIGLELMDWKVQLEQSDGLLARVLRVSAQFLKDVFGR